jgi:hypothetical protein
MQDDAFGHGELAFAAARGQLVQFYDHRFDWMFWRLGWMLQRTEGNERDYIFERFDVGAVGLGFGLKGNLVPGPGVE